MEIICDPSGTWEQPQQSTLANPAGWLTDALTYGRESDTGVAVNWRNAVGLSAAYYCINTISSVLGQLKLCIYERTASGVTEEDLSHPAGKVMRNPMEGPIGGFHLRNLIQNHALVQGNGRAFIVRNGREEPAAFVPLPAERTSTVLIHNEETAIQDKWHVVWPEKGEPIPIPDEDVLHIYRFSWDGYSGVPVLDLLRNSFGLGIAGDRAAAKFYKQGGVPSFVLEAPAASPFFNDEAKATEFLRKFNDYHAGVDNSQRVGLLRAGVQAKVLGLSNRDSQMLEQRDFQVRDIMRVFGMTTIPGVETTQAGYNGLEQLNRANLIHCFGPWMKIWEEECARKLLTTRERRQETYYFMFDTWELVKPDAAQEAEMLSKYVAGRILESNEARDVIGYAPHKDGKGLMNPNTTKGPEPGKPPAEPPPKPEPRTRPDQLIAAKLMPLVSAEVRRLNEMAVKAKHYIDWVEAFYGKHSDRMVEAVVAVGGETWMAQEYIEHSRYLIVESAGGCPKADLPQRIELATAAWPARIDELAATIAGAQA